MDSSASTSRVFRKEVAETLAALTQTPGMPEQDISLISFRDSKPAVLCDGNCRSSRALDELPTTAAGGQTPLFDAIVVASDMLARTADADSQKVLIVLSDGRDTISRHSGRDAINATLKDRAEIYCVDLDSSVHDARVLQSLSAATGGRYFPFIKGAQSAIHEILEGTQATYTVSYQLPMHVSGFHTVRILPTHNPNLQFRSRSGYYFPEYVR